MSLKFNFVLNSDALKRSSGEPPLSTRRTYITYNTYIFCKSMLVLHVFCICSTCRLTKTMCWVNGKDCPFSLKIGSDGG